MKARIVESREVRKSLDKAPLEVLHAYEIWARLIEEHGTIILRDYKGYHDEKLEGGWKGFRSSRLNKKWRVIYSSEKRGEKAELLQIEIVEVRKVTPHDYRRK